MQAFIAIPFDPIFKDVDITIREACKYSGFNPLRADDIFQPGVIIDQIFDQILKSDCVVGVLTGKNPNVYYEIGIAYGMSKPTILLHSKDNLINLPFDIKHKRVIIYKAKNLEESIPEIQAQLEFIKDSLSENISSEKFLKNLNFDGNDINYVCDQLMTEYNFSKLSLAGMEMLANGKGMILKYESPFGEKVIASLDGNGFITRSEKK